MSTPDHLERQAEAAMHRINAQINRSAGQHLRAVRRKVRAGQPTALHAIDTHQLPDARTVEQHGDTRHHPAPVHSAHTTADAAEPISGLLLLAYGLIALAATACAVVLAFAIGFYA